MDHHRSLLTDTPKMNNQKRFNTLLKKKQLLGKQHPSHLLASKKESSELMDYNR
jgi:hypothetical protein